MAGFVSLRPGREPLLPLANVSFSALQRAADLSQAWSVAALPGVASRPTAPDFEAGAADVIGPYLYPPVHAARFCVDEKTTIHALSRKDGMSTVGGARLRRAAAASRPGRGFHDPVVRFAISQGMARPA